MSNPAAPRMPEPGGDPATPTRPEEIAETDGANPFGPDAPNTRADDPRGDLGDIHAPPPTPPLEALSDADFTSDEG